MVLETPEILESVGTQRILRPIESVPVSLYFQQATRGSSVTLDQLIAEQQVFLDLKLNKRRWRTLHYGEALQRLRAHQDQDEIGIAWVKGDPLIEQIHGVRCYFGAGNRDALKHSFDDPQSPLLNRLWDTCRIRITEDIRHAMHDRIGRVLNDLQKPSHGCCFVFITTGLIRNAANDFSHRLKIVSDSSSGRSRVVSEDENHHLRLALPASRFGVPDHSMFGAPLMLRKLLYIGHDNILQRTGYIEQWGEGAADPTHDIEAMKRGELFPVHSPRLLKGGDGRPHTVRDPHVYFGYTYQHGDQIRVQMEEFGLVFDQGIPHTTTFGLNNYEPWMHEIIQPELYRAHEAHDIAKRFCKEPSSHPTNILELVQIDNTTNSPTIDTYLDSCLDVPMGDADAETTCFIQPRALEPQTTEAPDGFDASPSVLLRQFTELLNSEQNEFIVNLCSIFARCGDSEFSTNNHVIEFSKLVNMLLDRLGLRLLTKSGKLARLGVGINSRNKKRYFQYRLPNGNTEGCGARSMCMPQDLAVAHRYTRKPIDSKNYTTGLPPCTSTEASIQLTAMSQSLCEKNEALTKLLQQSFDQVAGAPLRTNADAQEFAALANQSLDRLGLRFETPKRQKARLILSWDHKETPYLRYSVSNRGAEVSRAKLRSVPPQLKLVPA